MNPAQDAARRKLIEENNLKNQLPPDVHPRWITRGADGVDRIIWAFLEVDHPTVFWITDLDGSNPIYREPS